MNIIKTFPMIETVDYNYSCDVTTQILFASVLFNRKSVQLYIEIEEWLNIRSEGNSLQHITWGVCVPSAWLNKMIEGDEFKRKK